jgi:hypothetical protein
VRGDMLPWSGTLTCLINCWCPGIFLFLVLFEGQLGSFSTPGAVIYETQLFCEYNYGRIHRYIQLYVLKKSVKTSVKTINLHAIFKAFLQKLIAKKICSITKMFCLKVINLFVTVETKLI